MFALFIMNSMQNTEYIFLRSYSYQFFNVDVSLHQIAIGKSPIRNYENSIFFELILILQYEAQTSKFPLARKVGFTVLHRETFAPFDFFSLNLTHSTAHHWNLENKPNKNGYSECVVLTGYLFQHILLLNAISGTVQLFRRHTVRLVCSSLLLVIKIDVALRARFRSPCLF